VDAKTDKGTYKEGDTFQSNSEESSKLEIISRVEPEDAKFEEWSKDMLSNKTALLVQGIAPSPAAVTESQPVALKKDRRKKKDKKKTKDTSTKNAPCKNAQSRIPFCKALRGLSDDDIARAMESGIPIHELTYEELSEIFPKLRMVADEYKSEQGPLVLGNTNSFDDSRPALLQVPSKAIKPALGLQSLYEYDFTSGKHMNVLYSSSGAGPKSSIKVMTYDALPQSREPRFVMIQVEVSNC
jgi:hypothetical protein